jgi:hypothetical protein
MSLILFLVVLVVIGVMVTLIPMDGTIKNVIIAIVCLCALLWLLQWFGVISIPKLR